MQDYSEKYLPFFSSRFLQLIILPMEQCNFRCVYCYESYSAGRIEDKVVEGIKNLLIARSKDLDVLSIGWFGGEPTLAYDVVVDLMKFIKYDCPHNPEMRLISDISTNGYLLTADRIRELVSLGVTHFQVTFDGDKDQHDKLRILIGNRPTFNAIWKNVLVAKNSEIDFTMTIRIHVNKNNVESVRRFIYMAAQNLSGDHRFRFFIRELSQLGGNNDQFLPIFTNNREIEEILKDLRSEASNLGLELYKEGSYNYVDICYAAMPNSFVIRSNGEVNKCTVALNDGKNRVGKLLRDGTLQLDKEKMIWWIRGMFSDDKDQLACPLLP